MTVLDRKQTHHQWAWRNGKWGTQRLVPGTKSTSLHRQGPWAYFMRSCSMCFHAGIQAAHKKQERHVRILVLSFKADLPPWASFQRPTSQQDGGRAEDALGAFLSGSQQQKSNRGPEVRSRFRPQLCSLVYWVTLRPSMMGGELERGVSPWTAQPPSSPPLDEKDTPHIPEVSHSQQSVRCFGGITSLPSPTPSFPADLSQGPTSHWFQYSQVLEAREFTSHVRQRWNRNQRMKWLITSHFSGCNS